MTVMHRKLELSWSYTASSLRLLDVSFVWMSVGMRYLLVMRTQVLFLPPALCFACGEIADL